MSICPTCQRVTDPNDVESARGASNPVPPQQTGSARDVSRSRMDSYATALPGMLECLPSKATCDMLYRSFVISIHSIMPLIHLPTFAEQYHRFWVWVDERSGRGPSTGVLAETPSFLPLLFSVLFSGAVTCSSEDLKAHFSLTPRGTISSLLCQASHAYTEHGGIPTQPHNLLIGIVPDSP